MARGGWALPLAAERSPVELGIERANALASVATEQLHVDAVINADVLKDISSVPGLPPDLLDAGPDGPPTYAPLMRVIVTKVLRGRPGQNAKESKDFEKLVGALGEVLYHWDAVIQDSLISRSDRLANGYELGRAVAETYWSLDPKAAAIVEESGTLLPNPGSWEFLLGEERRGVISQLLQRLAPYFGPLVAPSVAASVEVWGTVVAPQVPKSAWNNRWLTRGELFHAGRCEEEGRVPVGRPRSPWGGHRCQAHAAGRRHGGRRQSRRLAPLASPTGLRSSLFGA